MIRFSGKIDKTTDKNLTAAGLQNQVVPQNKPTMSNAGGAVRGQERAAQVQAVAKPVSRFDIPAQFKALAQLPGQLIRTQQSKALGERIANQSQRIDVFKRVAVDKKFKEKLLKGGKGY